LNDDLSNKIERDICRLKKNEDYLGGHQTCSIKEDLNLILSIDISSESRAYYRSYSVAIVQEVLRSFEFSFKCWAFATASMIRSTLRDAVSKSKRIPELEKAAIYESIKAINHKVRIVAADFWRTRFQTRILKTLRFLIFFFHFLNSFRRVACGNSNNFNFAFSAQFSENLFIFKLTRLICENLSFNYLFFQFIIFVIIKSRLRLCLQFCSIALYCAQTKKNEIDKFNSDDFNLF